MATSPNFSWPEPDNTDLVKNGALAIRTAVDAIDASMVDLKGGTTGQVLSKTSNTDMDFTWVTDAAGDITGVTAGTGISGGGTSGTVTVTNSMATAITTAGDLIKGTGSGTFDRLGIGTTGQVLTVAGGVPSWATPAAGGGGKVLQVVSAVTTTSTAIASTTLTDTTITATITPTLSTSKILVLISANYFIVRASTQIGGKARVLRGATTIVDYPAESVGYTYSNNAGEVSQSNLLGITYLDSPATTSATTYKLQGGVSTTANSGQITFQSYSSPSTITLMEIGA